MTRISRTITIAAAFPLLAFAAQAADLASGVQNLIYTFRADYGFPDAPVAVALPDCAIVTAATGLGNVEADVTMTPDRGMLAASIGKSFVATTVLAQEADGLRAHSDLVSGHLGDRDWVARLANHATMTIGDLLRHSAGLPDHVQAEAFAAAMAGRMQTGQAAILPEAAIGFVLDAEPLFAAGAGWAYSDAGYLLLGLIIEQVTGKPHYSVVTERFLNPQGLGSTEPSDMRRLLGLAVGYTVAGNPFGIPPRTMDVHGRLLWEPAMEWTGSGLVSASHDLARWGHALFGKTAMPKRYLYRLLDGIAIAPDAPGVFYGAGVAISADTPGGPIWGHGGWISGYVSSLRHYADQGITVALQINTDVGIVDDSTDLVPALEAALADLAIAGGRE